MIINKTDFSIEYSNKQFNKQFEEMILQIQSDSNHLRSQNEKALLQMKIFEIYKAEQKHEVSFYDILNFDKSQLKNIVLIYVH